MDEGGVDKIFAGCLDKLPPLGSKIVRIFTSSTFTDMSLERNMLMEEVYPKLKDYCRQKHGLEFQVVDMRWGVRDEATDDHMTTELCMNEIRNCQRLSMGANFVVFLGQKYGYRPVPTFIDGVEFRKMRNILIEVGADISLLDTWYKEDTNEIPSVYVLQPISSILANFNNKRVPKLQARDQGIWWDTLSKLQKLLRRAAQALFATGKMNKDELHNYMMSARRLETVLAETGTRNDGVTCFWMEDNEAVVFLVGGADGSLSWWSVEGVLNPVALFTEREVINGILKMPDTRNHCLAYIRRIDNINMTNIRAAGRFLDLSNRGIDTEAQELLADLRDNRLCAKMRRPNLIKFQIEWSGKDGLDAVIHEDYLKKFLAHFYKYIIKLVDKAMRRAYLNQYAPVVTEILQHLHACNSAITVFEGRLPEVEKIKAYFQGDSEQPIVLHGMGGCGKTSLLAKVASLVWGWYPSNKKPVMVLRFLGITPDSSCMTSMLKSICQQIAYNYSLPWEETPDDYVPLVAYLKRLLTYASSDLPLCILIDSVDQLSGPNVSNRVSWIPIVLPANVKMVVSILSGEDIPDFQILSKMLENEKQFVEVKPLGVDLATKIMKELLKESHRDLTNAQWKLVKNALFKCNLPIFVKLVFAEISRWKSYTTNEETSLTNTVMDSIMRLLERIEIQHGKILVSHALSYITASKSGVSELELEDLLSLDDQVLEDVYQYHLPPVRRIPPLLWTRIRSDLPKYLSEREADGVTVLNWYHRQFRKAAQERYFRNMNILFYYHCRFADYFLGTWGGGKPKPFKYTDIQRLRFGINDRQGMADRKVPVQPMVFISSENRRIRYNLRKFGELPFHLLRARMYDDLYDKVLFNYLWVYNKLKSCQLQAVLADYDDAREHLEDSFVLREIILVSDSIRLGGAILSQYPSMIASQIISRLLPVKETYPHIASLIKQCDSDGPDHCALVPANHCLHTPGGPMKYSLEGHNFAVFGFALTSDLRYVVSVSTRFIIWDLSTTDVSHDVDPEIEGIMNDVVVSLDDKYAIAYSNYNAVLIFNLLTGDVNNIKVEGKEENYLRGISVSDRHFTIWSSKEWSVYNTSNIRKINTYNIEQKEHFIIHVSYIDAINYHQVIGTSESHDCIAYLRSTIDGRDLDDLYFRGGLVIFGNPSTVFVSRKDKDKFVILSFRRNKEQWELESRLDNNCEKILALSTNHSEEYLIATMEEKFTVWNLTDKKSTIFPLPNGLRNITIRTLKCQNNLVITKNNQYAVGGVRKQLYIWSIVNGHLLRDVEAHFARIIDVKTVIDDFSNLVISSSIDRTVKVWNVDHIFERPYCVDRMEMAISSISLSKERNLAATATRNSIGIWNVLTGKLVTKLADSPIGAIITRAVITGNGLYVLCLESENLLIWDLESRKIISRNPEKQVKQFFLALDDTRIFLVKQETYGEAVIRCRSVPDGKLIYNFGYAVSHLRRAIVAKDNLVLSSLDKAKECLSIHCLRSGELLQKVILKTEDVKTFEELIPFPSKQSTVALVSGERAVIYDFKSKRALRIVDRWNGSCNRRAKYGLYAPSGGGLEIIDLKNGSTVRTLLPRITEGVFNVQAAFTESNDYIYYYHSGKRTIRLFRAADGKMIANFCLSADASAICCAPDGTSICVGGVDGSFITLTIVDPDREETRKRLDILPSRCSLAPPVNQSGVSFKTAAKVAIHLAKINENK